MLRVANLTYRIAGRRIFDGASATLPADHHVGLVGPNGCGKTTLLRLIAGDLQPDDGDIDYPSVWRMAAIAQEAPGGSECVMETVLASDTERDQLLKEADTATDPQRIAEIHTRLADIEAHSAPARAARILAGLGFDEDAQGRPCSSYSGGMRMRIALAAALFLQPDLLLLDEPTNHLDLESAIWLEDYLRSYPHTILLVSHDRGLLNRVVDSIVHVDAEGLTTYAGGYDAFAEARRIRLEHQAATRAKLEERRRHMQAFVDRFRYKASKARQAQSRLKAIARLEPIPEVLARPTVRFDLPEPEPLASPILNLEGVSVGYGDRAVLSDLSLRLDMDDRVALLGRNGNGKSTLAKLVAGRLGAMGGQLHRAPKLRVGYFAQHQTDELDTGRSGLAEAVARMPGVPLEKVRAHLGRFGFPQERAETRIGAMSGGEKARLLLAMMARENPHLLILDEPTNHLDIDSRDALLQALNAFPGAVILITHDPHLVEAAADRLWLVADGQCRPFDGDVADYHRLLVDTAAARRRSGERTKPAGEDGDDAKTRRKVAADRRRAQAPLRREAKALETQIAKLTAERERIQARLSESSFYESAAGAQVSDMQIRLDTLAREIAKAEDRWLEVHEAMEADDAA